MSGLSCTLIGVGTDGVCYLNLTAGFWVTSHWFCFGEPSSFIWDPYVWEMVWGFRPCPSVPCFAHCSLLHGTATGLYVWSKPDQCLGCWAKILSLWLSNAVRKWVALGPEGNHTNIQAFSNILSTLCCYQIPLQEWEHQDFRASRDLKWTLYMSVKLLFFLYHTVLSKQDSDLHFNNSLLIMRSKNEIFRTYFERVFFYFQKFDT